MFFSYQENPPLMKLKITAVICCVMALNLAGQNIGIQLSYIDSTYKPQTDFYKFCNGKWLSTTKIPESDSRWGSFNEINERNLSNIKTILKTVSDNKTAAPGSDIQKLRDFYLTAMDSVKADKQGLAPIKPELAKIDAIKTYDDVIKLCAEFKKKGIGSLIGFDVEPDLKNSNRYKI